MSTTISEQMREWGALSGRGRTAEWRAERARRAGQESARRRAARKAARKAAEDVGGGVKSTDSWKTASASELAGCDGNRAKTMVSEDLTKLTGCASGTTSLSSGGVSGEVTGSGGAGGENPSKTD